MVLSMGKFCFSQNLLIARVICCVDLTTKLPTKDETLLFYFCGGKLKTKYLYID